MHVTPTVLFNVSNIVITCKARLINSRALKKVASPVVSLANSGTNGWRRMSHEAELELFNLHDSGKSNMPIILVTIFINTFSFLGYSTHFFACIRYEFDAYSRETCR